MKYPRQSLRTKTRGMATAEVLLGLLVILLALALAFRALGRIRQRARGGQCAEDFQAMAAALEKYHTENNRWPSAADGTALLRSGPAPEISPFGGHYGWVPPNPAGGPGKIALTAFTPDFPLALSRAELLELDRRLDDGDLTTGRFRTGFNGWPVYLVGDKP